MMLQRGPDTYDFHLLGIFFLRVRLMEFLRKDRGCLAEKQTPKTGYRKPAHTDTGKKSDEEGEEKSMRTWCSLTAQRTG